MGVEYEWKFAAGAAQQDKLLREIPGQDQTYHMQTTYFDTPTGAYAARRCTLRVRQENGVSVYTLKAPAGGMARLEYEACCDSMAQALETFRSQGADGALLALADEGLEAICGAKFIRLARTVTLPGGTAEIAVDRGVLTGGGKELPLWEIEVEQKTCSLEDCEAFARKLAEAYGLQTEERSKFARAHALYKGE